MESTDQGSAEIIDRQCRRAALLHPKRDGGRIVEGIGIIQDEACLLREGNIGFADHFNCRIDTVVQVEGVGNAAFVEPGMGQVGFVEFVGVATAAGRVVDDRVAAGVETGQHHQVTGIERITDRHGDAAAVGQHFPGLAPISVACHRAVYAVFRGILDHARPDAEDFMIRVPGCPGEGNRLHRDAVAEQNHRNRGGRTDAAADDGIEAILIQKSGRNEYFGRFIIENVGVVDLRIGARIADKEAQFMQGRRGDVGAVALHFDTKLPAALIRVQFDVIDIHIAVGIAGLAVRRPDIIFPETHGQPGRPAAAVGKAHENTERRSSIRGRAVPRG